MKRKLMLMLLALPLLSGLGGCIVYDDGYNHDGYNHHGHYWHDRDGWR